MLYKVTTTIIANKKLGCGKWSHGLKGLEGDELINFNFSQRASKELTDNWYGG